MNNGLGVDDSSVPLTVDYFNGNVGVLNENPAYALDVTGQVNSTGGLCIAGTCKTDWSVMEGGWTQLVNSVFLTSSTDRVGIGISAPSVPLHVRPLGNYDEKIRVEDTGSNEWNYIAFYDSGTRKWFAGQDNVGSFVIGREAGGGTYTRDFGITASDNVGVGTTTPAVKFQVFGDIRVGTSGTNGCLQRFSGAVIVGTCASDSRLKTNIHPLRSVLKEFLQLNPVHYSWNEIAEKELGMSTKTKELGLLAQEVEKVFPELVTVDEKGYKRVDFTALQFYSIKAIQEQQRQIEELRNLLESRDRE